jgi:ribosomal protein S6
LRKYEALFILSNTISDDQMESKIEQISSEITKQGGNVQAATRMGRITFARPLAKKDAGNYVQLVFMMEPDKVKLLHERYRHNEDLIRLQIMASKTPAGTKATSPVKKNKTA